MEPPGAADAGCHDLGSFERPAGAHRHRRYLCNGQHSCHAGPTGPLDDDAEAALVLRNLRVSALVAGDQARVPSRPPGRDPVQLVGALHGTPIDPGSLPSGFSVDELRSSTELTPPAVGGVRMSFKGPPGTNGPGTIQPIYYSQTLTFIVYASEGDAEATFQLGNGAAATSFGASSRCSTLELNMVAFDTGPPVRPRSASAESYWEASV